VCGAPRRSSAGATASSATSGPHISIDADERGRIDVDVDLTAPGGDAGGPALTLTAELVGPDGTPAGEAVTVTAAAGSNRLAIDAGTIERWWPHTHGAQPLYELTVRLMAGTDVVDRRTVRVGFRSVELDTTPDATGAAFTFVVNGRPIFVRGVNWIPDDAFPTRVTTDRYRERLTQAVDAHCDMIRVWGGGIYEDDHFYDLCDELGLLVWQDFLFACAAYPEHLLAEEVEAEARDNVSRLMHHTSLAIWNGNNENIWGYWDWAWQEVLAGRSWGAGFYHGTLPAVCGELDPDRPYWPGSPWSGSDSVAPNADAHGCVHVWDVWNQLDLDRYRDHTPRFVSEFGWQAPPSWTTMSEHVAPEHFRRDSAAMRNHQKATDGDLKLDRGIVARFGRLDDLESFWYAAQVVQARAVRTGIEHFRSLRPSCMGTIWWQLNDCWPVASWAVVDSAGRPKPSWDALRDAYRPRLLTIQPRGDRLALVAVNDTDAAWDLDAAVQRLRLDGTPVSAERVTASIGPWETRQILIDVAIATPGDPRHEALLATDDAEGDAWWWYAPDRDLLLRPASVTAIPRDVDGRIEVDLASTVVVRDLVLAPERIRPAARVDRRLLTLRPGASARVTITGLRLDDVAALLTAPACRSVADLFA
jgi:beta-mannosidase